MSVGRAGLWGALNPRGAGRGGPRGGAPAGGAEPPGGEFAQAQAGVEGRCHRLPRPWAGPDPPGTSERICRVQGLLGPLCRSLPGGARSGRGFLGALMTQGILTRARELRCLEAGWGPKKRGRVPPQDRAGEVLLREPSSWESTPADFCHIHKSLFFFFEGAGNVVQALLRGSRAPCDSQPGASPHPHRARSPRDFQSSGTGIRPSALSSHPLGLQPSQPQVPLVTSLGFRFVVVSVSLWGCGSICDTCHKQKKTLKIRN